MSEPGLRVKLTNDRLHGSGAHVWVDDVEISRHLTAIEIHVVVNEPTVVHLVGYARSIEADLQAALVTTTAPIITEPAE